MSVKIADPILVEIVAETLDAVVKDIHSPTLDSESVKNILTTASARLRKAITETVSFEEALNRSVDRLTLFLEENHKRAWSAIDHPSTSSSFEQTHAREDEEKIPTSQLNQSHPLNQ